MNFYKIALKSGMGIKDRLFDIHVYEGKANFQIFARLLMEDRTISATACFAEMLDISDQLAHTAVQNVSDRLKEDPNVLVRIMAIRQYIMVGKNNQATAAIQDIFGIDGLDSVKIFESMRKIIEDNQQ